MATVYTATLNERFTLKGASLESLKSSASRIANRTFRTCDRMVVTGRRGGEFVGKFIFERINPSYEVRGSWVECAA